MCRHDNNDLIGDANGIKCRACGKVFASFAEVEADREKSEPQEPQTDASELLPETFDGIVKEKDAQVEKSLKTASDAKSAKKPAAKKTSSKKGAK